MTISLPSIVKLKKIGVYSGRVITLPYTLPCPNTNFAAFMATADSPIAVSEEFGGVNQTANSNANYQLGLQYLTSAKTYHLSALGFTTANIAFETLQNGGTDEYYPSVAGGAIHWAGVTAFGNIAGVGTNFNGGTISGNVLYIGADVTSGNTQFAYCIDNNFVGTGAQLRVLNSAIYMFDQRVNGLYFLCDSAINSPPLNGINNLGLGQCTLGFVNNGGRNGYVYNDKFVIAPALQDNFIHQGNLASYGNDMVITQPNGHNFVATANFTAYDAGYVTLIGQFSNSDNAASGIFIYDFQDAVIQSSWLNCFTQVDNGDGTFTNNLAQLLVVTYFGFMFLDSLNRIIIVNPFMATYAVLSLSGGDATGTQLLAQIGAGGVGMYGSVQLGQDGNAYFLFNVFSGFPNAAQPVGISTGFNLNDIFFPVNNIPVPHPIPLPCVPYNPPACCDRDAYNSKRNFLS